MQTQGIVVLLVASLLCFIVFRFMGDPVITLAGRYATMQEIEEVRRSLGLDKPMIVQYVRFLANVAQGNFGISYVTRVPALGLILERVFAVRNPFVVIGLLLLMTVFAAREAVMKIYDALGDAVGRTQQAGEHAQDGGLPGAVGSDQAEHLSAAHLQGEPIDR